jgi:hypothetical protein
MSDISSNYGNNLTNIYTGKAANASNIISNYGNNVSDINTNLGSNISNTITGTANNVSNLRLYGGQAQAAGIVGSQNARQAGIDGAVRGVMSAIGGMAGGAAGGMSLCDKRVKENIYQIGYLNNGLPVYKFTYKGSKKVHMNVMAQDVEKVNPAAVLNIDGLKYINMEKL